MRKGISAAKYLGAIILLAAVARPQEFSRNDRGKAEDMLKVIAGDIRKHYYDPNLHGLDWDAKVAEAKQKIDGSTSMSMALSHIAGLLDMLNDSHTFFLPPDRASTFDYGVEYQMVGDHCFVTEVRPHSDADTKGVKSGDEILTLNGYDITRDTLWKMQYVFSVLRPQPNLKLSLRDPSGAQREVEVVTKVHLHKLVKDFTADTGASDYFDILRQEETAEHLMRLRYADLGDQLFVLKLPEFSLTPTEVGDMMGKLRKHQNLIVDLRGNPGGSIETLEHVLGEIFEKDVKIADRVGRKESKPQVAKTTHNPFKGKIIVLVDSKSASCSELFARVIQLEKRGVVFGDHSSGSVMEARDYGEKMGADVDYGAQITDADLIMSDGKSLEHVGVTPDRLLLPSANAVAAGRDPVLAAAAQELGVNLSSEQAGKLFPYEWAPEN